MVDSSSLQEKERENHVTFCGGGRDVSNPLLIERGEGRRRRDRGAAEEREEGGES